MDTQTSYKRTVAGSVGAGVGAIFNGSGRTYYMLEHKTSSKFHQAGETQKIIIDQIELNQVQEQRNRVQTLYVAANTNYNRAKNKVSGFGKKDAEKDKEDADTDEKEVEEKEEVADNNKAKEASDNIANYYDDIYTLKVRRVTYERGDEAVDAGIALSNVVVGTGFIVDGKFVTARQNIEPWMPIGGNYDADWKLELAVAKYIMGCDVIIDYEAYSTRGSGYPIRFSNLQFDLSGSQEELRSTEVPTSVMDRLKELGLVDQNAEKTGKGKSKEKSKVVVYSLPYYTERSYLAVSLQMSAPGGLPIDREIANSLKGGETVTIAGFNNRTNIQNLSSNFKYWTSTTSRTGFNYITLQNADPNSGFIGSPAFYKEADGSYRVVGVNTGVFGGENRVVPITRVP